MRLIDSPDDLDLRHAYQTMADDPQSERAMANDTDDEFEEDDEDEEDLTDDEEEDDAEA